MVFPFCSPFSQLSSSRAWAWHFWSPSRTPFCRRWHQDLPTFKVTLVTCLALSPPYLTHQQALLFWGQTWLWSVPLSPCPAILAAFISLLEHCFRLITCLHTLSGPLDPILHRQGSQSYISQIPARPQRLPLLPCLPGGLAPALLQPGSPTLSALQPPVSAGISHFIRRCWTAGPSGRGPCCPVTPAGTGLGACTLDFY